MRTWRCRWALCSWWDVSPDAAIARLDGYCAPLLEVPMLLQKQFADGTIVVEPEEIEFSVNYSLVSELLGGDTDDLDDRLADLAELVPDFPIDATEFDTFWNGFRMIAPEVRLVAGPAAGSQVAPHRAVRPVQSRPQQDEPPAPVARAAPSRLAFVDFFVPEFPATEASSTCCLRLRSILGPRTGLPMSALNELAAMDGMPLHRTAFGCVFDPAAARTTPYIAHAPRHSRRRTSACR